jgi:3-dehydroquinate synthase
MVAAGQLAVQEQFWTAADATRQDQVIQNTGLPTALPAGIEIDQIVAALSLDKKVQSGQVRFIIPTKIGAAMVTDRITNQAVAKVLQSMN